MQVGWVLLLQAPAILHQHLFQRDAKNVSPSDGDTNNSKHALSTHQALAFSRQVEDFDSKGCLFLAEEVGSGDIWLHYVAVFVYIRFSVVCCVKLVGCSGKCMSSKWTVPVHTSPYMDLQTVSSLYVGLRASP